MQRLEWLVSTESVAESLAETECMFCEDFLTEISHPLELSYIFLDSSGRHGTIRFLITGLLHCCHAPAAHFFFFFFFICVGGS